MPANATRATRGHVTHPCPFRGASFGMLALAVLPHQQQFNSSSTPVLQRPHSTHLFPAARGCRELLPVPAFPPPPVLRRLSATGPPPHHHARSVLFTPVAGDDCSHSRRRCSPCRQTRR